MVASQSHQSGNIPDAVKAHGHDGLAQAYAQYLAWESTSWNGGRSGGIGAGTDVSLDSIGSFSAPFADRASSATGAANDNLQPIGIVPAMDKATTATWNDYGHSVRDGAMNMAGMGSTSSLTGGASTAQQPGLTPFDPNSPEQQAVAASLQPVSATGSTATQNGDPTTQNSSTATSAPAGTTTGNAPVATASATTSNPAPATAQAVEATPQAPATPAVPQPERVAEAAPAKPARRASKLPEKAHPFDALIKAEAIPALPVTHQGLYGQGLTMIEPGRPLEAFDMARIGRQAAQFYGIA